MFLHQAWLEPFFIHPGRYWRPVGIMSFQLGNVFPIEHRMLAQRVIQLLIACWLFISLTRLFNIFAEQLKNPQTLPSKGFCSLLALTLMLMPFYVENIAWIACRFELLLAVSSVEYCIATMNWMNGYRSTRTTAKMIFWMTFALLSKEIAPLALFCSTLIAAAAMNFTPRTVIKNFLQNKKTLFILMTICLAWIISYQSVKVPGYSIFNGSLNFSLNTSLSFWAFYGYAIASLVPWSPTTLLHPIPLNSFTMQTAGGVFFFTAFLLLLFYAIILNKIKLAYLALAAILPLIALSFLAGWTKTFLEFAYSERYLGGFPVIYAYVLFLVVSGASQSMQKLNWTRKQTWTTTVVFMATLSLSTSFSLFSYKDHQTYWITAYSQTPHSSVLALIAAEIIWKTNSSLALEILNKRRAELLNSNSLYASTAFVWNLRFFVRDMELQNNSGHHEVAVLTANSLSNKKDMSPFILTVLGKIQLAHVDCENAKYTLSTRDKMLESIAMSPQEKLFMSPSKEDYENEANTLALKCQ